MAPRFPLSNRGLNLAVDQRSRTKGSKLDRSKRLKCRMRRLRSEMNEIATEQSKIKEGQRSVRQKFEAIESECCESRKEATEILMQNATAQLRILSDFSLACFKATCQKVLGGFHEGVNAVPQDQRSSVGSNDFHHQGSAC
ncbi:hypothetical protein HRI_000350000 [Hibiscus trionum]|uniref:Uncharacterized protein n=1 Tax=Hibiscus trionum TaxID=183268 RepID=A0A9W7GXF4_HIBTR|nr:hypothetical protein HRI_000350000 [Hibiscus trionum]